MNEPTAYTELNPFTAIWTRPRETVRYVIEEKPTSFIVILLILTGFTGGLSGASSEEQIFPAVAVIFGSLLLGPLAVTAGIGIVSGIYILLGKLFGGVGTYSEMFRAVVTSSIPQIWLLPMWLIWLLTSPSTFYTEIEPSVAEPDTGLGMVIGLVLLAVTVVIGIWTFVIQCKGVGEAQRFSAWKGFFVIVIPSVLFTVVIITFLAMFLFAAF
ncbi:Yip1 family protein [Planococcus alpniumensis]|uniref:Yip1 family protein n=1 Tax=Planococcus alpniumensis TaxID=2708345 RepID=UPI001B8B4766|nr:Yip1 family protein [Planococcus sp. MSAK28401]